MVVKENKIFVCPRLVQNP